MYHHASGTSFSAPQVTAAAAILFGLRPVAPARPGVDAARANVDPASPDNGCPQCSGSRDSLSGWGRLDVSAAVKALRTGHAPVRDRFEPNDDIRIGTRIRSSHAHFRATIDWWDDPYDVYRVHLRAGQTVSVAAKPHIAADISTRPLEAGAARAGRRGRLAARQRSVHPPGDTERHPLPRHDARLVLARGPARALRLRLVPDRDPEQLEQLFLGHLADLARRVADDERARRDVADHDRARADERLLADLDPGSSTAAAADAGAAADGRPASQRVAFSVRPMKLSLVVTTQGATKTSSSSVE